MNAYDISLRSPPVPAQAPTPSPAQLAARLARFKINFLNKLIRQNAVADLVQLGASDARLLRRLKLPRAATAEQAPATNAAYADLALSIDVVDRLTGPAFNTHIRNLFAAARRYVVLHGRDGAWGAGLSGGRFTIHIARYFPAWRLAAHVPNPFPSSSAAASGDFFIYAREETACAIPVMTLSWTLTPANMARVG